MKNKILLFTLISAFLLSSCKKWLDLQPETDISVDELFSTENGFQESLLGVYTRCAQEDLYGKELTVGTPEVLAQHYKYPLNDALDLKYEQTSLFNYNDKNFISRKDRIWSGLYNAITNCNLILGHIDDSKSVFLDNKTFNIIKGEALGLRAYLHFDLLRMFAVSYKNDPSGRGIPYVTSYSKDITPMSNVTEVLDKVIEDLKEAKQLLASSDPILSSSYHIGYPPNSVDSTRNEVSSPIYFLQNRRHRLNYYAICATLARVYLYKNDKTNALSNAMEIINSRKFPWVKLGDLQESDEEFKDRIIYPELIFAWYVPEMRDELSYFFDRLRADVDLANSIYETGGVGGEDVRYKQWLNLMSTPTGRIYEILKYKRNSKNVNVNRHPQMAPAVRLSEVFYIASEALYSTNPAQGTAMIDSVRHHRGIGAKLVAATESDFQNELVKECRKEWFAEGQTFYMYKRLNRNITGQGGKVIPASDKIFVFPLPDDEILYGGR